MVLMKVTTSLSLYCCYYYYYFYYSFHVIFSVLMGPAGAATADNLSYINKYKEISGAVNTVGQIPCSVSSFEDVSMILWFKDSSGSPIYSYDGRYGGEPRHLTLKNDWGLRLYFRVWPSARRSPALMIRDLQPTDAGLYRCRVDYRNSPTTNSVVRLKIIEPPERLEVRDTSQFRPISDQQMVSAGHHSNPSLNDITYLGPYVEGQNVTVVCNAYGGNPPPRVIWLENGVMVDASYESSEGHYVTNELTIVDLSKRHSHDLYTCQASNHNETKGISHRINLDVYLTAKHIELEIPELVTAGVEVNLVCRTTGAYPTVRMEFWKVEKRMGAKFQTKSDADNATVYSIPYRPLVEDDEAVISCRAENPWIHKKTLEAKKKIRVVYPPVAVIRFGSSKTTNFSEGESVLFECHIKSNPALREIRWYHQLTHLTHLFGGRYTCEGFNDVGKGTSNSLNILINVAPRCASYNGDIHEMIPVPFGGAHQLKCNIVAWPPDLSFFWTLNRNGTVVPIPRTSGNNFLLGNDSSTEEPTPAEVHATAPTRTSASTPLKNYKDNVRDLEPPSRGAQNPPRGDAANSVENSTIDSIVSSKTETRHPTEGSETVRVRRRRGSTNKRYEALHHQSVLTYEILSEEDYGTVACWARNSYGEQLRPCLFHISSPEGSLGQRRAGPTLTTAAGPPTMETTLASQSNDHTRLRSSLDKGAEKVMMTIHGEDGGGVDEDDDDDYNDDDKVKGQEGDPLSYKLPGTLGITIIWMGVLIFIGSLSACSYLLLWRRRKEGGLGVGAAGQFTQPDASAPSSPPPPLHPLEKTAELPSPSIHNAPQIWSKTRLTTSVTTTAASAATVVSPTSPWNPNLLVARDGSYDPCNSSSSAPPQPTKETISAEPTLSLLFSHSNNRDQTGIPVVPLPRRPNSPPSAPRDDTHKHLDPVSPNLSLAPGKDLCRHPVSIIPP